MSDFVSQEFERRKLSAWILAKLFRISIHFYITGVDNFEKVFSTKEAGQIFDEEYLQLIKLDLSEAQANLDELSENKRRSLELETYHHFRCGYLPN